MSKPFADHVGITVPLDDWHQLRQQVQPLFDALGMNVEVDGDGTVLWRHPDSTGTVKAQRFGKVWSLGCSGAICAGLRVLNLFSGYLAAISTVKYRVTRLDATLDVPEDAAPIVANVAAQGHAGTLALTRKSIRPGDVMTILSTRLDGAVSGTVYCGSRRASVRMVVYDKQHERAQRKLADTGPLTRYELRLKAASGITLKDCFDPSGVFWHHAAPQWLSAPSDAPAWKPHGTGYELAPSDPELPAARLVRRVQSSADLRSIVALAAECGPYGMSLLESEIRKLHTAGRGHPADTALVGNESAALSAAATLHHMH